MRTENGIQYPDGIAMAFMPVLFVCNDSTVKEMEVTLTDGTDTVTVSHDTFKGTCYIDMSDYVQGMFGDITLPSSYSSMSASTCMKQMTYYVRKRTGSGWSMAINGYVTRFIWGAKKSGEAVGGNRCLVRTPGMPFCVDLMKQGSQTFNFRGGGQTATVTASSSGLWHVPIPAALADKDYIEVDDSLGTAVIRLDTCGTDGILLRWLDRHGLLCHRTFMKGEDGSEVTMSEDYRRNNLMNWDENYGWRGLAGDGYLRTRTDTIAVCAVEVQEDEMPVLMDMASSPVVEMYDGSGWQRVRIAAGKWSKKKAAMQDVEFNIITGEVPLQRG